MAQLAVGAGIKLFGATINLQQQQQGCYNKSNKTNNKDDDDVVGSEQESQRKRRVQEQESQRERVIACPRCKSMETKFCYFNNYNVNQPRHFCKGCQRYWTAGGALRNVPVGAGRRKVKPPGRGEGEGEGEGGCLYDVAGFELWEGWGVAAVDGGFRRLFPAKRRRSDSGGQQSS